MRLERPMKKSSHKKKVNIIKFKKCDDLPHCAMSIADSLYNKTGSWRSIKPIVAGNKCTSCLQCWKFCPEPCITMVDGIPVIDYDYCKGCGICIEVCPARAIFFAEEEK